MKRHRTVAMTRKLIALAALSLILRNTSGAVAGPQQVVVPTGEFPTDVQNIQTALDAGGTIHLKATNATGMPTFFNFGTSGTVFVSSDTTLIGETVQSYMTTIRGGRFSVSVIVPTRVEVRGIHFDQSAGTGLLVNASTGLTISSNKFTRAV